jgi:glycosyltransferase involved in cell wall biosynthesis
VRAAARWCPEPSVRILVLSPTFLPVVGGAELVLFEVYRRLARRHAVLLITPILPPALLRDHASEEYAALAPFPVERYEDRVSFMRVRGHRWSGGALPPFSLSAVAAVRSAIYRFQPDVLNVHYLMPTGLAGAVAERWLGVPTILTLNGRDVPGPGVPPLWRWWQRALLALVSDVTYVSQYCQDALYPRGCARGQIIYNGVEIPPQPGDGAAIRRSLDIPTGAPLFFALQRFTREKRVDVVLRAMRYYLDRGGTGALVVGGKGPEEARLRALAGELGIHKQVHFAGYIPREQLGSYFLACDVFVFHSTFETFGLVVAQAMSYGRAVATVRNTALPEVLGDAGLLVETGDWRALGDAMMRLAHDEALRRRLGESGRARAETLFNWDRVSEQYEAVLARGAGKD